VATPDNEELRARIKALEQRLAELEKKLQQK
jgi:polyhydroxyalkanoate synthesis regulator phasin